MVSGNESESAVASSPVSLPVRGREEEPGIHRLRMR